MSRTEMLETLPMVPLRDVVIFPHMIMPFVVGRRTSINALESALRGDKKLFLATQHDANADNPGPDEIYTVGVVVNVLQSQKLDNGNIKVLVQGLQRGRVLEWHTSPGFVEVVVKMVARERGTDEKLETEMNRLVGLFEQYIKITQAHPYESLISAVHIEEPDRLTDTLAAHLQLSIEDKQNLLEIFSPSERLFRLITILETEVEKIQVDKKIQGRVKRQMEKAQKEYYLNEKMRAIQNELGKKDDRTNEVDDLGQRIRNANMPKDAEDKAMLELKRLEAMPPVSAEATVSRNYLEWLITVPWHRKSREQRDIKRAQKILDEDHYGLEKVKERIIEFLAVRRLVKKQRGSILCFAGPPGVGKTSLARSIARATGRKFVRLSLGGVRDEAEIRGHRRTYIGAFPGQIIQLMKKAGTKNPIFLMDEVDKMSSDFRGDPSAALLEVLDPEQNHTFMDHYLDVEFDLSSVMFIATANVLHPVPPALKDRMEVIRLAGYTLMEKLKIAEKFLIPRQLKAHGLKPKNFQLGDETLTLLIERYTREAGVRNLEREIASLCRKVAKRVVEQGRQCQVVFTRDNLQEFLGVPTYRKGRAEERNEIGVSTGLAWTEVGGEILSIEISLLNGRGKLTLTGKLGEVMQESAQTALSYARRMVARLPIDQNFYRKRDIHVHIPEGAIPKDGPSAGVALATALISAITLVPVRKDVAMTGEVTLRGKVLPVGGIKEKVLAAYRHGIRTVILPMENEKDLEDIPDEVRDGLTVHLVDHVEEVLRIAMDHSSGNVLFNPSEEPMAVEVDSQLPTN